MTTLSDREAALIASAVQEGSVDAIDLAGLVDHPDEWIAESWTGTAAQIRAWRGIAPVDGDEEYLYLED
jgi:hypothetical protein